MKRRKKDNDENKVDLFLDSGAFSAWTQGIEINIQDYIEFIKKYKDEIDLYANLDVISFSPNPSDKEEAARKTLENQKIMESAGLSPLPVFHVGEPWKYLEYYLKKYDYIGLGGMVQQPKTILIPWLDKVFGDFICDKRGYPKVKVHGFGLTSVPLMIRYPWYSVDSTTWVVNSRLGRVFIPSRRNGKWGYGKGFWTISVSSRSPDKKKPREHIDNIPPIQKKIALEYIHELGYSLGRSRFEKALQSHELKENERWAEKKPKDPTTKRLLEIIEEPGLSNKYELRDEFNIIFFQNLEKALTFKPFKQKGVKGFLL